MKGDAYRGWDSSGGYHSVHDGHDVAETDDEVFGESDRDADIDLGQMFETRQGGRDAAIPRVVVALYPLARGLQIRLRALSQ